MVVLVSAAIETGRARMRGGWSTYLFLVVVAARCHEGWVGRGRFLEPLTLTMYFLPPSLPSAVRTMFG